jgi:hypothetical protein
VGSEQVRRWADAAATRLQRKWHRPQGFRIAVVPGPTGGPHDDPALGVHSTDADGLITVTLYAWPLLSVSHDVSHDVSQDFSHGAGDGASVVHQTVTELLADALGVHPDDL